MMQWWKPQVGSGRLLYRARFEALWAGLPRLLVLAALPGWGKRTWMEQCAGHLRATRPDLGLHWASGIAGLGSAMDGARRDSPELLCFLDAREPGHDEVFWESLGKVLDERPWARCVVACYDGPPREDPAEGTPGRPESVLAGAVVMHEGELSFDAEERAAIAALLTRDGLLNDFLLNEDRELGCPYLIGQHIKRMTVRGGTGIWTTTDPRVELRLLNLLDQGLRNTRLAHTTIGWTLVAARSYRAFSPDLITLEGIPAKATAAAIDRLAAVPLFDRDTDDETETDQCVWRADVWRALAEGETGERRVARLERGLEGVRATGRIAAPLHYLLELDRDADAEELVRGHFRWFLIFCDRWTTELLEATEVDPERTPALALLQIELRLRSKGVDPASRGRADAAFRQLRQWTAGNPHEQIERSGLLAFGATLAGRRQVAARYIDHLLELIETADIEVAADDAARVRIVGACYLAYWAALQTDRHTEALHLATAMVRHSDPRDRLYLYEQVSLTTEEDLHGLRSLSPSGERPSARLHSQTQPLIDLEEGRDTEALAFLQPILSQSSRPSRSALDAFVLLVRAVCAPEELSTREIERPLRRGCDAWEDGRASSLLIWAAVVAFASIGAKEEARGWVDSLDRTDDVFASLARVSFAHWQGRPEAALRALESMDRTAPPRFTVCAWTLTAASHAMRDDADRAILCLETAWREHPAPRLFRFALRLIPQNAFESLRAMGDRLPEPVAQVFEDSREDGRAIVWITYPKLTPSEREILKMLWSGMTNQQIADSRFVAIGTVRSHLKALYRKLGASDRLEALAIANRFQLLEDGDRGEAPPNRQGRSNGS